MNVIRLFVRAPSLSLLVCILGALPARAQSQPSAPAEPKPQPAPIEPAEPSKPPTDGQSPPNEQAPQAPGSSPTEQPSPVDGSSESLDTTEEKPASADAHVVVFVGANPAPGVRIGSADVPAVTTNEQGSAVVSAPTGGTRIFQLSVPRELVQEAAGEGPVTLSLPEANLVEGETIELIVTLTEQGTVESVALEGAEEQARARAEQEAFAKAQKEKPLGTIRGTVTASETKAPIVGAHVYVRGAAVEAATNERGEFSLELPEGHQSVSVIHPDFSTETQDVEINAKQETTIALELTPASVTLDDFVITAPHIEGGVASLMEERRQSSNVTDVIGAQEMSRSGASDAAGALKRVTGINIVGGKYVYVRGMGDRYSATLLNGQLIPSPEPERRVIPLDIFPTQVLESVLIQKTFSPDLPAEFGGGMVQLRTRSYPERLTVQATAQIGANTQTTLRDGPTYRGGGTDWLGTDDGTRELPQGVIDAGKLTRGDSRKEGYEKAELAAFGRQLPDNWNVYRRTTPFDRKFTLTLGDKFQIGSVPFGFLVSGVYSDSYQRLERKTARYFASEASEGGLQLANSFNVESLERTVSTGGIVAAGSEYLKGQSIKSTTLLLRVTDDSVNLIEGVDSNLGRNIHRAQLRFIERQLLAQQVAGQQTIAPLNDAVLDWRYAYATASLNDPDRRSYQYLALEGATNDLDYTLDPETTQRVYTKLNDDMHAINVDYTQPIDIWSELQAKAKVGGMLIFRKRDYNTYRYQPTGSFPYQSVRSQAPDDAFAIGNFSEDGAGLLLSNDIQLPTDAYTAEQTLQAAYGMAEIPIVKPLEVVAGVRVERSKQEVTTFPLFSSDNEPIVGTLDNTDILPGSTVTWRFTDEMAVRGGFGRTVNRPDFRELSRASFYDVTTNSRYEGNPELQRATINNYDARWEWYFSTDELLSVGAFYKTFDRPIEVVVQGGSETLYSWQNAESATNYGVEFEGRRRLDWIADPLENFFISSNVAIIHSSVELGEAGTDTSSNRALQGQAPYVVNTQVGFDDTESDSGSGLAVTLLYNVTGPAIAQVGLKKTPNIEQQPFHQVDLTVGQRLPGGFTASFRARNLLDPEFKQTQGPKNTESYHLGRSFSLGLAWAL